MHLLPRMCHYLKIGRNSLPIICQLELQLFRSKTHKSITIFSTTYFGKKGHYQNKHKIKIICIYICIYMQFYGMYISNNQKLIE